MDPEDIVPMSPPGTFDLAPPDRGPPPTPGNADPQAAYAYQPPAAPAPPPPPQGQGTGLGGVFSMLGGGGGGGQGTTQPGMSQGMIGLGLGMLAGNPFNKWGAALQGYQRGAAADVARAQQAEAAKYHQQELAVPRAQMAQTLQMHREELQRQRDLMQQQYTIAMKPQMHFVEQYDPEKGYVVTHAFRHNPANGELTPVDIDAADKARTEGGGGATVHTSQGPVALPPNMDVKTYNEQRAKNQADIEAGKVSIPQMLRQWWYGQTQIGSPRTAPGTAPTAPPPRPSSVPADATPQQNKRTGQWRWKSGNSFWDDRGTSISEYVR